MVREGIYSWGVFYAKRAVKERMQCSDIVASVIAGTVAAVASHPFDTLTTFRQNKIVKSSNRECIDEMIKEGGLKRFYKGIVFRWVAVVAGIYVMDKTSQRIKNSSLFIETHNDRKN